MNENMSNAYKSLTRKSDEKRPYLAFGKTGWFDVTQMGC
jgi:hypothetical protein